MSNRSSRGGRKIGGSERSTKHTAKTEGESEKTSAIKESFEQKRQCRQERPYDVPSSCYEEGSAKMIPDDELCSRASILVLPVGFGLYREVEDEG